MLLKKRWTWPLIIGILMVAPALVRAVSGNTITWFTYNKAQQVQQDRKYFVYFYSDRCGHCRNLESRTFTNPDIVAYINRNYTPVRVNIDRERQIAAHYGVNGVPDLYFLSSTGAPIGRQTGFVNASQLLPLLKYIHTESYLKQDYSEFLKDHS
jgi:thioredoxin-related protein